MSFWFQLNQTTGSKSDGNGRKWTKTKWNFDYGSNDSVLSPEFKNHLGFEIRWKFNFGSLLAKPRKILKKWKLKPPGIQQRPEIHLKIKILKSWRSKWKFRNWNDPEIWLVILNFEFWIRIGIGIWTWNRFLASEASHVYSQCGTWQCLGQKVRPQEGWGRG